MEKTSEDIAKESEEKPETQKVEEEDKGPSEIDPASKLGMSSNQMKDSLEELLKQT